MHNAIEGCVHESFAALMAALRARRASDPRLRRVFAKIAVDETRHGQLAWDLHAWLRGQLSEDQARAVESAQHRALARLPDRARALQSALPDLLGGLSGDHADRIARAFVERLAA